MATFYPWITDEQSALINNAPLFFVATADPQLAHGPHHVGPVNLSPKGGVPLHILTPNRVAFLDYAGSGNETARHSLAGGPITVMVCSFEDDQAAIVRLYGRASVTPLAESPIAELLLQYTARELNAPPRQVIDIEVEQTMTSCGYGVPAMSFVRDRRVVDRGRRYKGAAYRARREKL
ncbi:MAG TPA: pyridoxamine 5'-phosphate oxidase family protein [Herpetosiphonaceae bacterium]